MAEVIPSRPPRRPQPAAVVMPGQKLPPAPAHLNRRSRRLWKKIVTGWSIGDEALDLLRLALEQLDRYDVAGELLAREGLTVTSKAGLQHAHPAVKIQQDALAGYRACMRQLGLEPTR